MWNNSLPTDAEAAANHSKVFLWESLQNSSYWLFDGFNLRNQNQIKASDEKV